MTDPGRQSPPGGLSETASRELAEIYARLDAAVAATGVRCFLRGHCCDFTKADHRLFASSVEIAYVREAHPAPFSPGSPLCPFWRDGLCHERERRPLGCRTYFCDEVRGGDAAALYERFHAEVRDLADRHGIEYRYEPFVDALRRPAREAAFHRDTTSGA